MRLVIRLESVENENLNIAIMHVHMTVITVEYVHTNVTGMIVSTTDLSSAVVISCHHQVLEIMSCCNRNLLHVDYYNCPLPMTHYYVVSTNV